jgi:pseudouridine-5'-phosphate glycosidase
VRARRRRASPAAGPFVLAPEVRRALAAGRPLVALETAVLALGLPAPSNLEAFAGMLAAVRRAGAVPAAVALDSGRVFVGLDPARIARLAEPGRAVKVARRDLGPVLASGRLGATTVSSTAWLAHRLGIAVLATGGIGGVHPAVRRGEPPDISADLATLASIPVLVVSTGVKAICDAPATAELLESLSVAVVGAGTDRFPHFYAGASSAAIWPISSPADAARAYRAHVGCGATTALLVANPVPPGHEVPARLLAAATRRAALAARRARVAGPALTPFLLRALARATRGRTVAANRALLIANATLAARIAVELAGSR